MPDRSSRDPDSTPIRKVLLQADLPVGPPHPCPYLHDRAAREQMFSIGRFPAGIYESLIELNFRRGGKLVYRPACESCNQCRALRVRVPLFAPNRSQRRCWTRNQDLHVTENVPEPTEEKYDLFRRYLASRHDREMDDRWAGFVDFLYTSPIQTVEVTYRLKGRLVAIGLLDLLTASASTVYCYFEPDLADRSPGTFNVLWSIRACRARDLPHLHLGYYIRECPKMSYKINFRPCEILQPEGAWQESERNAAS